MTTEGAGGGPRPDRRAAWLDVRLPRVLLVGLLVLVARLRADPVGDPDTFWHLRAGYQLLSTRQFLPTDDWSAFNAHPWVLHEWGPEVLLALADSAAGLAGVMVLQQVAVALVVASVLAACRPRGTLLQALVGTTVAVVGLLPSLGPRPQLVSFALLAVALRAWLATAQDHRARWWLVPLTWVWACCHGFWVLGPGLGALVALAMLLDDRATGRPWRPDLRLLLVPVLSAGAGLVTPIGWHTLSAAAGVGASAAFVSEWAPPSLSSPVVAVMVAAVIAVALVWWRRGTRVPWVLVAVWVAALLGTLTALRTVAIGAVLLAPLVTGVLAEADTDRAGPEPSPSAPTSVPVASPAPARPARTVRTERLLTALAVVVTLAVAVPTATRTPARMPTGLDHALDALPPGTVVLDYYDIGGWLDWAHPDLSLVVDGRTEIFATAYLQDYVDATKAKPGWPDFVHRVGARAAVLPVDSPLGGVLQHESGWRVDAQADGYRLLLAP